MAAVVVKQEVKVEKEEQKEEEVDEEALYLYAQCINSYSHGSHNNNNVFIQEA